MTETAATQDAGTAGAAAETTTTVKPWNEGLDSEFMKTIPEAWSSKFKDKPITEVLKSHIELEKSMGNRVEIPNEKSTEEQWKKFTDRTRGKLEDYDITRPEGVKEEDYNVPMAETLRKAALDSGMPTRMFKALKDTYIKESVALLKALDEKGAATMKADEDKLKTEWKGSYDANMGLSDKGMNKLGLKEILTIYGLQLHPAIRKAMKIVGELTSEETTTAGNTTAKKDDWPIDYSKKEEIMDH